MQARRMQRPRRAWVLLLPLAGLLPWRQLVPPHPYGNSHGQYCLQGCNASASPAHRGSPGTQVLVLDCGVLVLAVLSIHCEVTSLHLAWLDVRNNVTLLSASMESGGGSVDGRNVTKEGCMEDQRSAIEVLGTVSPLLPF